MLTEKKKKKIKINMIKWENVNFFIKYKGLNWN